MEEYETGFWIPNSEYGSDSVILGKNVVFKQVAPGVGWVSKYRTQGDWGYVVDVSCTYNFLGFSVETILNRQVKEAKVTYARERKVISDAERWHFHPRQVVNFGTPNVGQLEARELVPILEQSASTTKHDTRMIGYIGSGDP